MHAHRVGSPYHPAHTTWPEAAQFSLHRGQLELLLFIRAPSRPETRDIARGRAEFALVVAQPVVWLLYRFGHGAWSDAPTSVHLVPAEERGPAPAIDTLGPEHRALLRVILVDAATGIVRALRVVSLAPSFTETLFSALNEQLATAGNEAAYDVALAAGYARWPSTEAMLGAATVRCVGGS